MFMFVYLAILVLMLPVAFVTTAKRSFNFKDWGKIILIYNIICLVIFGIFSLCFEFNSGYFVSHAVFLIGLLILQWSLCKVLAYAYNTSRFLQQGKYILEKNSFLALFAALINFITMLYVFVSIILLTVSFFRGYLETFDDMFSARSTLSWEKMGFDSFAEFAPIFLAFYALFWIFILIVSLPRYAIWGFLIKFIFALSIPFLFFMDAYSFNPYTKYPEYKERSVALQEKFISCAEKSAVISDFFYNDTEFDRCMDMDLFGLTFGEKNKK